MGSNYYVFDPVVATLPDLTQMQSLTYVNEVDIHRIAVGQPVDISLDAEPSKRLSGRVVSVANVGEQHPNEDAKVFEVVIDIAKSDTTFRPGMTTANTIEVRSVPNVLAIPLRAVTIDSGFSYVYKQSSSGAVKQMIETGAVSSTEIVVTRGLAESDHILLDPPSKEKIVQTVRLAGATPAPTTPVICRRQRHVDHESVGRDAVARSIAARDRSPIAARRFLAACRRTP